MPRRRRKKFVWHTITQRHYCRHWGQAQISLGLSSEDFHRQCEQARRLIAGTMCERCADAGRGSGIERAMGGD